MFGRARAVIPGLILIGSLIPIVLARPQRSAIELESGLVTIDVTVMNEEDEYVTDLDREDFTILHDGLPRPIAFFETQRDRTLTRPLAVVFALDVSGSLGNQIADQQYAARQFVHLVQENSLFAVIGFNDRVHIYQRFTSDPRKLQQAFARARNIGGRTRLYDAINRAITMLVREAPRRFRGRRLRRVVVVITDGFDYTSVVDREELIRRANNAGVTIYSVTLPSYVLSVSGKRRVPTLLDASGIVARTGGIDFPVEERNFARIFRAIAEEIRASYVLSYYPPPADLSDGQTHRIKILINRPGVKVRQSRYEYTAPQRR